MVVCDIEDNQKILYIIQKSQLPSKLFLTVRSELLKGLQYMISKKPSTNKLVSIVYAVSYIKKQYGILLTSCAPDLDLNLNLEDLLVKVKIYEL